MHLWRMKSTIISCVGSYDFMEKYEKLSQNYHQIPTLYVSLYNSKTSFCQKLNLDFAGQDFYSGQTGDRILGLSEPACVDVTELL